MESQEIGKDFCQELGRGTEEDTEGATPVCGKSFTTWGGTGPCSFHTREYPELRLGRTH